MLCEHRRPINDCPKCWRLTPDNYDDTDHAFYQDDDGNPLNEFGVTDDTDAWAGITAS